MPSIAAHAKINLGLEILGRRDDGFHEIRSVFARLDLHDTLTIRPAAELGVRWPTGMLMPSDDLIRRAATLLCEATGTLLGARITLEKNIPVAGGLGGGSSDAGAALHALNEIWQTGLGARELSQLGAQLSSDIPAFFHSSPALVRGRGEIVEPLQANAEAWVVLVAPNWDLANKTATLYRALTPDHFSDGWRTQAIADLIRSGSLQSAELTNTFEAVIDQVFPLWSGTRARLEAASGVRFWLTGAGPSMYALLSTPDAAREAFEAIAPVGIPAMLSTLAQGALRVIP
jgi:4-diphosphocytidyl-2-C-methyl-D-erythritol kinase